MIETDLGKVYNYSIHIRDAKRTTNKRFSFTDNGSMDGFHWTWFHIKDNKSSYFHSFGGLPDSFCFNNHQKQPLFIIMKLKTSTVSYVVGFVYAFNF